MSLAQGQNKQDADEASGANAEVSLRLDRLERKIDALLLAEKLSDMEWRSLDTGDECAEISRADPERFEVLTATFVEALERRTRLAAEVPMFPWKAKSEPKHQAALDQLSDEMLSIAGDLAAMPATTIAQIRAKAMAVHELAEQNSDDIIHRLAVSLADDLFGLKDIG